MNPDHRAEQGGDDTRVMAARVVHHADLILKAAGSGLRHYTLAREAILMAAVDMYEEAYRAGAEFAAEHFQRGDAA